MTVNIIGEADSEIALYAYRQGLALRGVQVAVVSQSVGVDCKLNFQLRSAYTPPDDDPHGDALLGKPTGVNITSRWTIEKRQPEPVAV